MRVSSGQVLIENGSIELYISDRNVFTDGSYSYLGMHIDRRQEGYVIYHLGHYFSTRISVVWKV